MGLKENGIDEQLNLLKLFYKLKTLELRKKCKILRTSKIYWSSKNEELREKLKTLVSQINRPESSINEILQFKAGAKLRSNLITNKIRKYKTIDNNNHIEQRSIQFNDRCTKLAAEYDDEKLRPEIIELDIEKKMLHFECEGPNQQIQDYRNVFAQLELKNKQNNVQLDEVVNSVQNTLESKTILQKKLQYYKKKMKFLK